MSLSSLFDHQVRIYRLPTPLEARGTLGSTSKVALPVTSAPSRNNARADQRPQSGDQTDLGAGEKMGTKRLWLLDKGLDVQKRDVLSVVAGPESGGLLYVEDVRAATMGRTLHHYEVTATVWKGELGE